MSRGLQRFLFRVEHRDGRTEFALFFAESARQATRYARQWAQRLGNRRVELVEDQEAAA